MEDEVSAPKRVEDSELALKKVIHDSNEILAAASTVPTFQSTVVILSRTKLIVEKRSPLKAAIIMSARLEDLISVNATVGPIFGRITIVTKITNTPLNIGIFWRKDAIRLRRIAHGYIIALQNNIDLDPPPTEDLKTLLYELGIDDNSIK